MNTSSCSKRLEPLGRLGLELRENALRDRQNDGVVDQRETGADELAHTWSAELDARVVEKLVWRVGQAEIGQVASVVVESLVDYSKS